MVDFIVGPKLGAASSFARGSPLAAKMEADIEYLNLSIKKNFK